jgi:3-dehydroquinate synthase
MPQWRKGILNEDELNEISSFIFSLYPRVEVDRIMYYRLVELIRHDKKNLNDRILMTLLEGIGNAVVDQEVKADLIIDSLNYYSRWSG